MNGLYRIIVRERLGILHMHQEPIFCTLTQPNMFGSKLDKDAYFRWIQAIPGVTSVEGLPAADPTPGAPARLRVGIDMKRFDEWSLREIFSLYYRFDLDFEELRTFINDDNKLWVYDPQKFWAKRFAHD